MCVQVIDTHSLQTVTDIITKETLVAVAAMFGSVRLIDNVVIGGNVL